MLTASFLALFSDVPLICCILPVEKGEAGSGELEASGQRAAHQGEAEASLWGQGQCGAFVRMADPGWRGGLRNHWPRFCLDSKSKLLYVLTPQSCVSRALHPYLAGNGVPGVCLSWLLSPALARVRLLWAHLCSPRAGRSLPCSGVPLGLVGLPGPATIPQARSCCSPTP